MIIRKETNETKNIYGLKTILNYYLFSDTQQRSSVLVDTHTSWPWFHLYGTSMVLEMTYDVMEANWGRT
jgi:hypothetical protein